MGNARDNESNKMLNNTHSDGMDDIDVEMSVPTSSSKSEVKEQKNEINKILLIEPGSGPFDNVPSGLTVVEAAHASLVCKLFNAHGAAYLNKLNLSQLCVEAEKNKNQVMMILKMPTLQAKIAVETPFNCDLYLTRLGKISQSAAEFIL